MTQSMKFTQSNSSVDVTEAYDDKTVRIAFWNTSGVNNGYVDFNEIHLRELRKWITVQIRKIKSKPSNKK